MRLIDELVALVLVEDRHPVGRLLHRRRARCQLPLALLPVGDVLDVPGDLGYRPVVVADRCRRQRDVDLLAVFADASEFDASDRLAPEDALANPVLVLPVVGHRRVRFAEHLVLAPAQYLFHCVVPERDLPLGVGGDHTHRGCPDELLEVVFGRAQFPLCFLALGHVGERAHRPHDLAVRVPQGCDRERHVDERPVLPTPSRLYVSDHLVVRDALDDLGVVLGPVVRDDRQLLPEHLRFGPVEDALCRRVPQGHPVFEVECDQRRRRRLDDRVQPLVGLPHLSFPCLPLGDVPTDPDEDRVTIGVLETRRDELVRDLLAAFHQDRRVDAPVFARLEDRRRRLGDLVVFVLREELGAVHRFDLRIGVSGHLAETVVPPLDSARLVEHVEHVIDRVQDVLRVHLILFEALFALAQLPIGRLALGDVPGDPGNDPFAVGVLQRRRDDLVGYHLPVFRLHSRFEGDPRGLVDAGGPPPDRLPVGFDEEVGRVHRRDLLVGVAGHRRQRLVPPQEVAVRVEHVEHVVDRVEYIVGVGPVPLDLLLPVLALGHVLLESEVICHLAGLVLDR